MWSNRVRLRVTERLHFCLENIMCTIVIEILLKKNVMEEKELTMLNKWMFAANTQQ